ncbi:serine acetyltransferase [Flavobacterium sp.]|jgi:serine O-acetyltransferase|uniref:serine O-acetyltransferase n=1 Tax=Flavobacterium sp. TaxID=239 RepID=UPI00261E793A|nr:serine acetyltransferase [Flavobacterium sp.]
MTLFSLIRSDYRKYKKYGANGFVILFLTQGFWALFQYRIAHFFHQKVRIQPFRMLVMLPMYVWQKGVEIMTGISIPASAQIGHSFYMAHFGGIILNSNTIIGNNCNISQGVTIGVSGLGVKRGVPIIGNNVYIGANAVIAGKISISDNSLIGACSLVSSDVPENGVVVGVPAILVSNKSSKGYI